MLKLENLNYTYDGKDRVLNNVNYTFKNGKVYAIVGNSGAGKTTVLSLLAGLDMPTSGLVTADGEDISKKGYEYHRKNRISLVFQNYNLINYMTSLENIRLADRNATADILRELGLSDDEIKRNVMKLSGGQQQRVAIGRALVAPGDIILADEPTGNLDEDTAEDIMDIFIKAAHEKNKCVIIVTHSHKISKMADVVLNLKNKTLKETIYRSDSDKVN